MFQTEKLAYDPYDPDFQRDPYPSYRQLRIKEPAHYVEAHDFWVLTRYEDLRRASGDPALTSRFGNAQLDAFDPESLPMHARSMASLDAPDHTALRHLVQSVFSQKLMRSWMSQLQATTERIVGELKERSHAGDADVIRDLARPLPADVMIELMALSPGDRDQLIAWSSATMAVLPGIHKVGMDVAMASGAATESFADYFDEIVNERRRHPVDGDVVSQLIAVRDAPSGRQLSHNEVVGHCVMLVLAALETTEGTIGNAVATLLRRPDDLRRIREDRSLIPAAMDEVLRWEATAQGVFRSALEDVEYAHARIPAGSRIQLVWASANRDEQFYKDGEAFDIDRERVPLLSFGHGAHYCLGAFLARAEMAAIFDAIFDAASEIELSGEPVLNLAAMPVVRKHLSVPVSLH